MKTVVKSFSIPDILSEESKKQKTISREITLNLYSAGGYFGHFKMMQNT